MRDYEPVSPKGTLPSDLEPGKASGPTALEEVLDGTASSTMAGQTSRAGSQPSTAATVVPFQRGAAETSEQTGQIPARYSQGSGTIVSGTTANKATEAALAAYPGESSTVS
jgi:hypothetical protein